MEYANEASSRDVGLRSEQPEVAESLFNCRDLVWWAGILLGCGSGCYEAELLFAVQQPGALRHKAVLARDPFLDFLVRGAWTKRLMLAGLTRAPMSSFLVSITHPGFEWLARLFSRGPKHKGIPIWADPGLR